MDFYVPSAEHRITLLHDASMDGTDVGFQQGQNQNKAIVTFAQSLNLGKRFVAVEVFYERVDVDKKSSEEDFDALWVDTIENRIVTTMPSYDSIDPNWRDKR